MNNQIKQQTHTFKFKNVDVTEGKMAKKKYVLRSAALLEHLAPIIFCLRDQN